MPRHRPPLDRPRLIVRLLATLGLVALPIAATAAIDEHLGSGMPLVLKDGRIANVTIHSIPFATGAEALDPPVAAAMEQAFRPLATDCFLTAQAIGHVAPGITRDGDTLTAHRLARARADGIQALLAGLGMPQPAVASVWDWQFLVQRSQVTLWIFSLNVGDDCEGTPLPLEAPTLAAADVPAAHATTAAPPATPPVKTATAAPAADTGTAAAAAFPAPGEAPDEVAADGAPRELLVDASEIAATPITEAPITAAERAEAQDTERLTGDAGDGQPGVLAATPPEPPTTRRPDPLATAAVAPTEGARPAVPATPGTTVAALAPDDAPAAAEPDASALVITFDVNSSFFPAGAGRQLRDFLASLPEAGPVEVEVATAVGSGDVRGASGEEARRYNAWMAERRAQRVVEWLEANAGERTLTVTERLVEDDASREVRLTPKPGR